MVDPENAAIAVGLKILGPDVTVDAPVLEHFVRGIFFAGTGVLVVAAALSAPGRRLICIARWFTTWICIPSGWWRTGLTGTCGIRFIWGTYCSPLDWDHWLAGADFLSWSLG